MTTSEEREFSHPDRGRRRALAQKQRPARAARRETVLEFVVAGYERELTAQKLGVRRRPITTEAIGSAPTHPSLRGALATKQSRGHNMRGASNPDDRTAAPGLLPATRARGRNDGQGIGSLVSACRASLATARREVGRATDQRRLDAPDRHIHPNSPNLETAPGAVDDALERADLNAAEPPFEGVAAIERDHGPTVPAPPRYRPPQLSSLERGGKLSCPQSLENTQNRKIHETAPGAVDDALERADLNSADLPLEGVGAVERDQAPSVAGPSRYQPSQSSPSFERGGNFPGRKALKIHKTATESRFVSILSRLRDFHHAMDPVGRVVQNEVLYTVIPAKAGIQGRSMCGQVWMPAFAGMTLVSPRKTAPRFDRLGPLVHAVAVGGSARSSDIRTNRAANHDIDRRNCRRSSKSCAAVPEETVEPFGHRDRGAADGGVARKWRRNALKRLNPRPEMVGPRRRRTYKMWYSGARLKARDPG